MTRRAPRMAIMRGHLLAASALLRLQHVYCGRARIMAVDCGALLPPWLAPRSRAAALVVNAVRQGRTFSSGDSWVLLPPDVSRWDPFILLVEVESALAAFPWHPHRGSQTLTHVLDGCLEHRDIAGGAGALRPRASSTR
jgi:Pirin